MIFVCAHCGRDIHRPETWETELTLTGRARVAGWYHTDYFMKLCWDQSAHTAQPREGDFDE